MKRIAIVVSSLAGGGTQQYILSLVDYLYQRNIEIFIYLTDYIDNTVEIKKAKKRYLKNNRKNYLRNLILIFDLRKQIKSDKIDDIISFLPKVNCISSIANLGLNSTLTVCERNDPIKQKLPFLWSILRLISYNFADVITANSFFALDILIDWFPLKKKFFYTSNFIRNNIYGTNNNIQFKKKYKYFAVAIGRLSSQKNYKELIKAFSFLSNKDIGLNIIGSGPLESELREMILNLGLENQINIVPYNKCISNWLKLADFHIMSSLYEGSPNVLWEASFFSVPSIISSNINAALEILEINKSVLVYKSGEYKSLANKIDLLISDEKLRDSIASNAKQSTISLSSESVFEIWLKILKIN